MVRFLESCLLFLNHWPIFLEGKGVNLIDLCIRAAYPPRKANASDFLDFLGLRV